VVFIELVCQTQPVPNKVILKGTQNKYCPHFSSLEISTVVPGKYDTPSLIERYRVFNIPSSGHGFCSKKYSVRVYRKSELWVMPSWPEEVGKAFFI
jgi:hypothetical protein